LSSALDGGKWSASRPSHFTPVPTGQDRTGAPDSVEAVAKRQQNSFPPSRELNLDRPDRSLHA